MAKRKPRLDGALDVDGLDKNMLLMIRENLETDPKYSLEVDPTGALHMTSEARQFTKWYIQHRNVAIASQLAGIKVEDGIEIYKSRNCQSEITRITDAMHMRQLNISMLNVDQIGSILTAFVMDFVPEVDRLSPRDKMIALKTLLEINESKKKIIDTADPEVVDAVSDVSELSVDEIKALLEKSKTKDSQKDEKEKLIMQLDADSKLSNDDLKYLRSLSIKDLKKLIEAQKDMLEQIAKEPEPEPEPESEEEITLTPVKQNELLQTTMPVAPVVSSDKIADLRRKMIKLQKPEKSLDKMPAQMPHLPMPPASFDVETEELDTSSISLKQPISQPESEYVPLDESDPDK